MSTSKLSVSALGHKDRERFWAKVRKAGESDCWPWTGSLNRLGYGRFKLHGKTFYAHRVSFALRWGDSPQLLICHRCDNPACVNPEHLYDQSHRENTLEASERGRLHAPAKHKKPRPDFPLFPHASGRWAKKIRGRFVYFGKVADDPDGERALNKWLDEKDDHLAGRTPRSRSGALTVTDLCDRFLVYKDELLQSGELAQRTFDGYKTVTDLLVAKYGHHVASEMRPEDFQTLRAGMAKRWGPIRLGNQIQVVRSVFKYGHDAELLDKPVRFGLFKKPSAKVLRSVRTAKGPKMFTAEQLRKVLEHTTVNMTAMALLAINGGLGNTDLAVLPAALVDGKSWLDYPRGKTGIPRRIPLWPETVEAVEVVMKQRPADQPLLFIGKRGVDYIGNNKGYRVHAEFAAALREAGIEGRTFYDLRRTFQTIGEGANDLAAVQAIMGHAPPSGDMSAIYRQRVSDKRLLAVTNHVRSWLYPPTPKKRKAR